MGLQILLHRIDFRSFLMVGWREVVYSRNVCPSEYVLKNGDSYPRLPSDANQAIWLVFPVKLVLVLLMMLLTALMAVCVHVSLALRINL
jgi:hypothetical protein